MNYKVVSYTLGCISIFEAGFMLLPLIFSVYYGEQSACMSFALSILICLALGFILTFKKQNNKTLYAKEGFAVVAISWIYISIVGAIPFYISSEIPSFIDALFETVSGFTTTGASILTNVEALSNSMLLWRSFTHWIGGMGVLVFIIAIIPLSGNQNIYLMKAESPGPSVGKLVPHIKSTAMILYSIYFVMTIAEFLFLVLGKMPAFDALNLSFATAGTGGFGIKNTSVAGYDVYSQIVITIFMILFGVNFNVYYLIIAKKFKDAFKSTEVKVYIFVILSAITMISFNIYYMFNNVFQTICASSFQVASIITTTGFATYNFDLWPQFSRVILVVLMFIGACAGSTGGGIKVSRIIILFKTIIKEISMVIQPRTVKKITFDGKPIEHEVVRSTNVYFAAYVAIFTISVLILSIDNFSTEVSFTAVAATINNIGPGLDLLGPVGNYSHFSIISKLVLVFDMLAGRLELFPLLVLFSPKTWKK